MNEINFLPDTFLRNRIRRRRILREVLLCTIVASAVVFWHLSTRGSLEEMERYTQAVEQQAAAALDQNSELSKQKARRTILGQQVRIQRELAQPLEVSQVLMILAQQMPESVTLTEMSAVSRTPQPTAVVTDDKAARSRNRPATNTAIERDVMRLTVLGLAPSDVQIANLVGRLSEHALFTNVKLNFSRATKVHDLLAREFSIEVQVPMDCDYKPSRPTADGKVAPGAPRDAEVADAL